MRGLASVHLLVGMVTPSEQVAACSGHTTPAHSRTNLLRTTCNQGDSGNSKVRMNTHREWGSQASLDRMIVL